MIDKFEGKYAFLSNFYVVRGGIRFHDVGVCQTVEHAFQASKASFRSEQLYVLVAPTPAEAKRRGRKVTLRPNWDSIKDEVMYNFCKQKFFKHPYNIWLLSTGNEELVEDNTWGDTYWGVCNGIGENKLGKILMQIRSEFNERQNPKN